MSRSIQGTAVLLGAFLLAGAAFASPPVRGPAAATPARGMHLVLLGTAGGPGMRKRRLQPASLIVVNGRPYLIDAGSGVTHQLVAAGFQPAELRAVFLTHLHMDHTQGLASLMAFTWSGTWGAKHRRTIGIYGPPGTQLLVHYASEYDSISEAIFAPEVPRPVPMSRLFHAHDVALSGPALVYQDRDLRVLAVPNTHYVTMELPRRSYGIDESYAYRFETKDRTIVFTGDTGWSDAVAQLARGADILVSEVILTKQIVAAIERRPSSHPGAERALIRHMRKEHLSPGEVGRLATRAHVKMVVLTHIVPSSDTAAEDAALLAGVKRWYDGPVVLGRDLDRF